MENSGSLNTIKSEEKEFSFLIVQERKLISSLWREDAAEISRTADERVLPEALSDVLHNGDEFGRNAAMRLIDIWEERKVFGSRVQVLKEELLGKNREHLGRNEKNASYKKQVLGNALEKIISSYEVVYDGPVDEDSFLSKCNASIDFVEKFEKDVGGDYNSGAKLIVKVDQRHLSGSELAELQGQHEILREYIDHLKSAESSRATLVSNLREALQEEVS
ncbi:hypothetical protein ACLOJK_018749 [Asimina triloba]